MVKSVNLGFPRVGEFRELKKATESYWKGNVSESELLEAASQIRKSNWQTQKNAGIEIIPSNDFSFYDQTLDHIALFGAVPARYNWDGSNIDLKTYFAMARGRQTDNQDVVAMEMTKWFDTNYHYIVPELYEDTEFKLSSTKVFDEYQEAKEIGIETRPVLIGPMTFILNAKARSESVTKESFISKLTPVFIEALKKLESLDCKEVQIDEPFLALDLTAEQKQAYKDVYAQIAEETNITITLTTYFEALRDNTELATNLPVAGLHIDLVRGENQLDEVLNSLPEDKFLSIGVVDGRNIWKNNFEKSINLIDKAVEKLGKERVLVAPSCSLLHSPVNLENETKLDEEFKNWLSFAKQKLSEIATLTKYANEGRNAIEQELAENAKATESRKTSSRIHNNAVKDRVSSITEADSRRNSPFAVREKIQNEVLGLPALPTTTIGSFPQTKEVRAVRRKFKNGEITQEQYDQFIAEETKKCIDFQEEASIDVPVHGEFERNDMVEYFGEQLEGFAFTENGWVQSYGTRCVKPPIIFGDVSRPEAMTVRWTEFAQSLTDKPVKGMLTGPITILQWSFVRNDQPRETTCKQIALSIRDEVKDLQDAGIQIIQIDEPAIREGLPLRDSDKKAYLNWAVDSFRISSSGIEDKTQIHTHMCYSEFNDIMDSIADMDADVISIETSRSAMELLDAFVEFEYPNQIGPGVYDIHSPRVPQKSEMVTLLEKALKVLRAEQVWVNPDCGLKTRGWEETSAALKEMVEAAKELRGRISSEDKQAVNG
jgi:5-methyltetrahydropteroyltriglutamate--homocysteine methyltransferase